MSYPLKDIVIKITALLVTVVVVGKKYRETKCTPANWQLSGAGVKPTGYTFLPPMQPEVVEHLAKFRFFFLKN